jgi:hypothetical protein
MNVFDPLSTYSSPSRRAVDRIEPKASDPEFGSVIAHAPILSSVRRSRAHRSFCAVVPRLMIAALVRPIDTPIAVTMPGQWRHNSMIGIIDTAASLVRPDVSAAGGSDVRSRSMRRLNCSRAMASIPNVANSLRRMS